MTPSRWDQTLSGQVSPLSAPADSATTEPGRNPRSPLTRTAFLAMASEILSESLDYNETLQRVARLCVPLLADACLVDLAKDGAMLPAAVVAIDADREALERDMRERYPIDLAGQHIVAVAWRTGQPQLRSEIDYTRWDQIARSPEHRALLEQLNHRSYLAVPLRARGRTLGVISLASVEPGRYTADDVDFVVDVAQRCAMAIDTAGLFASERDARAAAEDALRARDEFLASISHDLKHPLAAIKGFAQLLDRRARALSERDREAFITGLGQIDAAIRRMTSLVDDLVDATYIKAGTPLTLHPSPTDLVALVRQVIAGHQQTTQQHTIGLDTTEDSIVGDWDALRLERVVANLLSNAIKYSPDGGEILVTITRADAWPGPRVVLSVRDQGVGIAPEDLPRVFERFYRGHNVASHITGTGLGLAAVEHIVRQHGGEVSVESTLGQGSTFTIALPLSPPLRAGDGACPD